MKIQSQEKHDEWCQEGVNDSMVALARWVGETWAGLIEDAVQDGLPFEEAVEITVEGFIILPSDLGMLVLHFLRQTWPHGNDLLVALKALGGRHVVMPTSPLSGSC